ncbi:MAG: DUF1540 domain-containing protein [Clostridia bacterium]|nr:DUF1540 domain-containing protein [Clostridia bacterium]
MNDKEKHCSHHNEGISCDVTNCQYHCDGCHCSAKKIDVGPSSAVTSSDTICATFKPREE